MAEKNNNNDPVVVEETPVDLDAGTESVSKNVVSNNAKYITIAVSIISSVVIYMLIFSGGSKEDKVDSKQIIVEDKTISKNNNATIDNIDSLVSMDYGDTIQNNNQTNKELLELPELPELPESITQNIEQEVKEAERKDLPDNVFTKDEVDEMINMKLQSFETEMNKIKNESERLAKELEKKKMEEEENKKKRKFASILGDEPKITPPNIQDGNVPSSVTDNNGLPPDISGGGDLKTLEEQKKEEDRELMIAQRRRIMQERRSSTMFKMQGGGGGNGTEHEQDSIIITDKDSLQNVADTKTSVVTTKSADLSRTVIQGKIIAAVLENAINTDVKNQVRAIVSRDIYSESGKNILIPKGSRVIGNYQTVTSTTIARLDIVWNRIIRVDGLSISINSSTADNLGRGGVEGDLDNKYTQIIRNAFLSSVVSIASAALVDKITDTVTTTTTSGTEVTTTTNATNSAIIDATKDFGDEMQDIVDGLKKEKPTIRIAQGTKLNIVVNQDLVLPIYKQKDKYEKF